MVTLEQLGRAIRRSALLGSVAAILSACAALSPMPNPGPTQLEAAAGTQVEVAVDNRSSEPVAITVSQRAQPRPAHLIVGGCDASNFIYPMEGAFSIGFGKASDFSDRPMPELVASDRLDIIDGAFRLLIRVGVDGEVAFGRLEGVAPLRSGGC